mmetsp:Transcript_52193/g.86367  ORF Transcript_52193/g.86367 Transcript_52193/m.86367 type:complete len:310 (-) Transcript_52193:110-1039(-)
MATQIHTWKLDTTVAELEGSCYTSDIFSLLGFSWLMKFYPEHRSAPGNATATLYLVDLPPILSQITVQRKISIRETGTISDQTKTFKDSKGQGWPKNTLLTKHMRHLKKFTFTIQLTLISKYRKDGKKLKIHTNGANEVKVSAIAVDGDGDACADGGGINDEHDGNMYELQQELRLNTLSKQMRVLMRSVKQIESTLQTIRHEMIGDYVDERKESVQMAHHRSNVQESVDQKERMELKAWLANAVKLPEYFLLLVENGVDTLEVMQMMDNQTLDAIGIHKIGHKMRILKEVSALIRANSNDVDEGMVRY